MMYSVVVSAIDRVKLDSILVPSLDRIKKYLHDNGLPELQLVVVEGTESLTKNYNEGLRRCRHKLKLFIHDDINLVDDGEVPLFVRISLLFNRFPDTGLVGLAGTTGFSSGWWWQTPRENMVGQVFTGGKIDQHWVWNTSEEVFHDVNFIDGMFMATVADEEFSEDIKGFHLYDNDYCNVMKSREYTIKVINHMVRHEAEWKDITGVDFTYYREKWNLQ